MTLPHTDLVSDEYYSDKFEKRVGAVAELEEARRDKGER